MYPSLLRVSDYEHSSDECSKLTEEMKILIEKSNPAIFDLLPLDTAMREIIAHATSTTLFIHGLHLFPKEDFVEALITLLSFVYRSGYSTYSDIIGRIISQMPIQTQQLFAGRRITFKSIKEERNFRVFKDRWMPLLGI